MIKIIPKKKRCKKAPEEALQIAEKRREAKGKGEKERHTHLNAEFQRIARRDKKGFLGDQCKELEENNRMGKTCKKAKWLSEEALQIAVKRREAKSKGEKERYKHLNAEFQRIARRDKKAFLSNQCKEIEENNRIGKTRDLFQKIREPKEHFMQRWAR